MAIQKAGRLQFQDVFEVVGVGSFTVNFGNAATGSGTFATSGALSVPGAALGDLVLVAPTLDVTDAALDGQVTSAGVVEVTLLNNTAGAVDLASMELRVVVLRLNPAYDAV